MSTLYLQIKDDILKKIESGQYKQDQTIPTELELASYYQVSRPTIRHAIELLVDQGYLEKEKNVARLYVKENLNKNLPVSLLALILKCIKKVYQPKQKFYLFIKKMLIMKLKKH